MYEEYFQSKKNTKVRLHDTITRYQFTGTYSNKRLTTLGPKI